MSELGTKTASKYKPERTITIKEGDVIPEDKDVYVQPRAVVKFSNEDSQSYTIVFLVHNQDPFDLWATHADVDLFLPAFGSATMVADRDVLVGQCRYLVEPTNPDSIGVRFDIAELAAKGEGEVAVPESALASSTSSNAAPIRPRQVRSASRGGSGGGGTIHIGS
jgi:hypothetical protein